MARITIEVSGRCVRLLGRPVLVWAWTLIGGARGYDRGAGTRDQPHVGQYVEAAANVAAIGQALQYVDHQGISDARIVTSSRLAHRHLSGPAEPSWCFTPDYRSLLNVARALLARTGAHVRHVRGCGALAYHLCTEALNDHALARRAALGVGRAHADTGQEQADGRRQEPGGAHEPGAPLAATEA